MSDDKITLPAGSLQPGITIHVHGSGMIDTTSTDGHELVMRWNWHGDSGLSVTNTVLAFDPPLKRIPQIRDVVGKWKRAF